MVVVTPFLVLATMVDQDVRLIVTAAVVETKAQPKNAKGAMATVKTAAVAAAAAAAAAPEGVIIAIITIGARTHRNKSNTRSTPQRTISVFSLCVYVDKQY